MNLALTEQIMALAGVVQAAALVQQLARNGSSDSAELQTMIDAVLNTDPESTEAVFGSLAKLRSGLSTLLSQLSAQGSGKDVEITRYAIALLALERRLAGRPSTLSMLGERLTQAKRMKALQQENDDKLIGQLAEIYVELISPLGPRIQVAGNPNLLKTTDIQNQIRTLLLAGLRCAVLWRQLGGRRRHLLLNRKRLTDTCRYLLQSLNQS